MSAEGLTQIGEVIQTSIYPVVGMAEVKMPAGILIKNHSVVKDRFWGYHRLKKDKNGFESLELLHTKDLYKLSLFQPFLDKPEDVENSEIWVRTPSGLILPIESNLITEELEDLCQTWVRPFSKGTNLNYSGAISGVSRETLTELEKALGHPIARERFRMNFEFRYIYQPETGFLNKEETLVGTKLAIGDYAEIAVQKRALRCAAVNITVEDGEIKVDPNVLKNIPTIDVENPKLKNLGFYATISNSGWIHPNDPIYRRAA